MLVLLRRIELNQSMADNLSSLVLDLLYIAGWYISLLSPGISIFFFFFFFLDISLIDLRGTESFVVAVVCLCSHYFGFEFF